VPFLQEIQGVEGNINLLQRKSPEEVMGQVKGVIAQIDEIKGKLSTPGLELSPAVQTVMQNKLSHIDDKLRVAVEQVGGEYQPSEATTQEGQAPRNPLERFTGVLEASEEQLHAVFNQVDAMGANNKSFNPATMFLLQIKVSFVQQELEFFTAVLNKALESTKTLMNIQV
jgi:hypothetical protein